MRAKRSRNRRRSTRKDDEDLPFEIEAGEIVVVQVRNGEAIAREYQRGLDSLCRTNPQADDGVFAQRELLRFAVAHQFEAAFCFDDLPAGEFDGLKVAIDTSRREPGALEFGGDEVRGFAMGGTARIAALHLVEIGRAHV